MKKKGGDKLELNLKKMVEHINEINKLASMPSLTEEKALSINEIKKEIKINGEIPLDFIDFYSLVADRELFETSALIKTSSDEYAFEYFLPIEGDESIKDDLLTYKGRMPSYLLPFSPDYMGNRFVISCKEDDCGSVYLWLHDYEYDDEEDGELDEYVDNLIHLAKSFTEFIMKMKVNEDYLE
jgi:hypothetical protein